MNDRNQGTKKLHGRRPFQPTSGGASKHAPVFSEVSQNITDKLKEFKAASSSTVKNEPPAFNRMQSSEMTNKPWGHTDYPSDDPQHVGTYTQGFQGMQAPTPPAFHGQHLQAPPWGLPSSPFPAPVFNPAAPPPGLSPFPTQPPPPTMASGFPGPPFGQPPPPFPPQNKYGPGPPPPRGFGTTQPGQQSNFGIAPPQAPFQNRFETAAPQNSFGGSAHTGNNYSGTQPPGGSGISGQPPHLPTYPLPQKPPVLPSKVAFQEFDVKSASEEDKQCDFGAQQEINRWLEKMGKLKLAPAEDGGTGKQEKAECGLSICEAHEKLRNVLYALAAVQSKFQHMEDEQDEVDEDTWNASVIEMEQLKETYLKAKQDTDLKQIKALKRKVDQRKKKRERQKRQKREKEEEQKEVLFERAKKHAAIDEWQEKIHQEHLNQQQVKKMKETADKTLSKVRREIREARKMLDTVNRLQKLRAVRNDMAEKRGQNFPGPEAEHFKDKTQHLAHLLAEQIDACEKEEAALKLILETEKKEAKEKEEEEKRQKEEERKQLEIEEERQCLFGPAVDLYPGHPMKPFVEYYEQAQRNLESFINIRREWDRFLVPEDTPMASRIPDGWVIPEAPASASWASVLQQQSP